MDPTREENYIFLETFLAEMSQLFPDKYFHFGGDEGTIKVFMFCFVFCFVLESSLLIFLVRANDWSTNTDIQDYIKKNGLKSVQELQAVLTRRMIATIKNFGKTPIGTLVYCCCHFISFCFQLSASTYLSVVDVPLC
jgi:hexosaminidase